MSTDLNIKMVTKFVDQKPRNKPVDKLMGKPTIVMYSILEEQVALAASAVKTSQRGVKHGHLALISNEAKYRFITTMATSIIDRQVKPPALIQTSTTRQETSNASNLRGNKTKKMREFLLQEETDEQPKEK